MTLVPNVGKHVRAELGHDFQYVVTAMLVQSVNGNPFRHKYDLQIAHSVSNFLQVLYVIFLLCLKLSDTICSSTAACFSDMVAGDFTDMNKPPSRDMFSMFLVALPTSSRFFFWNATEALDVERSGTVTVL